MRFHGTCFCHLAVAPVLGALLLFAPIAQHVARNTWGADPCGGQVALTIVAQPRTINAVSVQTLPGPTDCRIEFNPNTWWDWGKFCTVLVHEYGHLTGHEHSPDPADVMYPYYAQPFVACVPRYLPR